MAKPVRRFSFFLEKDIGNGIKGRVEILTSKVDNMSEIEKKESFSFEVTTGGKNIHNNGKYMPKMTQEETDGIFEILSALHKGYKWGRGIEKDDAHFSWKVW